MAISGVATLLKEIFSDNLEHRRDIVGSMREDLTIRACLQLLFVIFVSFLNQRIHDGVEQRRKPRKHKHSSVPSWVCRRFLVRAQDLVGASSIHVVIWVALDPM